MGVKVLFRCESCDARPDRTTQRTLERRLLDRTAARFLEAQPGSWLIWTAGGTFGPRRYSCPVHRAQLIADVRRHFGGRCAGARQDEPFEPAWPPGFSDLEDREVAELLSAARALTAGAPQRPATR